MYFNSFAQTLAPLDLSHSDELASLVDSAHDLGIAVPRGVRYASRNLVVNGLRFHCLEWGDPAAPALLLLHGGNQTAHSWDLVSLAISDRYHIVAIDQRGHGDSEWPRDGEASRQSKASDAVAILELLGISTPIVVGHSMGGIVTITLLAAHPGLARKAVLVDIAPEIAPAGARLIGEFVTSTQAINSLEEFVDRVAAYDHFRSREHIRRTARYNIMQRAGGGFVSKHDHRERLERRNEHAPDDSATVRPDRASYAEAAQITCPTLVIRGAESPVLLPEMAERFAAALPQGELVTVPQCGHNVHSQNTPGFLEALLPFIDQE